MEEERLLELIAELDKRITELEHKVDKEKIDSITERVDDIEEFLNRRTRGFYMRYITK